MLALLTKRLARSMMRSKVRITAVVAMVAIAVFSGLSFASYAHTISGMYDKIYEDSDQGMNLPDIWVENPSGTWDGQTSESLCEHISESWEDSDLPMNECEPRLKLDGTMFHTVSSNEVEEEKLIPAVWHGIDEGIVDRVWIPDHQCCSGRIASDDDEIVIDYRAATSLGVSLNDTISIGAGSGRTSFTVVGIGFQSNHLYFSQEGSLFPAEPGTFATGYLSSEGLERLANLSEGSSNLLLIDVIGTPDYNIPTTDEEEGAQLTLIVDNIDDTVSQATD